MTAARADVMLAAINLGAYVPDEIRGRSIALDGHIEEVLRELL